MNYFRSTIVIFWYTRNWRHQKRSEMHCKNYGMQALHKTCYIGSLYKKEQAELVSKLEKVMNGKLDRLHSFVICSSCLKDAKMNRDGNRLPESMPTYEMVQSTK